MSQYQAVHNQIPTNPRHDPMNHIRLESRRRNHTNVTPCVGYDSPSYSTKRIFGNSILLEVIEDSIYDEHITYQYHIIKIRIRIKVGGNQEVEAFPIS